MSTIVDDVVREVLDRLRLGTASGNRLIAPVDSDVPGSKVLLHGPHGRSMTSAVACRHVSRVCLFGRRCSPSRPEQRHVARFASASRPRTQSAAFQSSLQAYRVSRLGRAILECKHNLSLTVQCCHLLPVPPAWYTAGSQPVPLEQLSSQGPIHWHTPIRASTGML
jgi:hypothetical protein